MKLFYSVAAAILLALVSTPLVVFAQDARTQLIIAQCSQLQSSLNELQRRDLVARTNMGREYENIDKQLNAFTQRVHNNNFNQQPYTDALTRYREAVNQFRAAYVIYDDGMIELQNIDCKKLPGDFSNKLKEVSALRAATNEHVTLIDATLSQYRSLMIDLLASVGASQ